jgi:hypothetical protein
MRRWHDEEGWRRWSELDGRDLPSEERRGCRWERVVEVAARVLHPFIGSGRRGGGPPCSDGSGGGRLWRGGEEEAAPIEGGERRRRPRDIWSRAEDVAKGARRRAARSAERRC